jgi:cytosine/adenosine deaminase-related metal-dependent hydrolase
MQPSNAVGDQLSDLGTRPVLLRGGTVISMDPSVGDFATGDVLFRDGQIEKIGELLEAPQNCVIVDASNRIVLPGFVDTHRHSWQGQFRRLAAGMPLGEYIDLFHHRLAPAYTPTDFYAGTYLSALGALDSGITTMLDFAHNARSSAHTDAGINALADAGLRAVHTVIGPVAGEWDRQLPADLKRIREQYFATDDQLLTMRMGAYGLVSLAGPEQALSRENRAIADELDIALAVDATFGTDVSAYIEQVARDGVLDDKVTLIHATDMSQDVWQMVADVGAAVSLCPTSDAQVGCMGSIPPVQQILDYGVTAGISVDVECCLSTDIFAQMQAVYTIQRMHAFNAQYNGVPDAPEPIVPRVALHLATLGGAQVNGLGQKVGSLTPGKRADIVMLDTEDLSTMPHNNAVASAVLGTTLRGVREVFVDGQVKKWDGELVGVDRERLRSLVYESRDRLLAEVGHRLDVTA